MPRLKLIGGHVGFLFLLFSLMAGSFILEGCHQKNKKNEISLSKTNSSSDIASIYKASLEGNTDRVRYLIRNGIDVNVADSDGRTPLMFASFNGHTVIVKALLKAGSKPNAADFLNRTALTYAASGPFPETVKLLLKHHADPNIVDNNEHWTPLMNAAAEGQMEVVKLLLQNGAKTRLKDVDGDTAESFAREKGHIEVANYLKSWINNHDKSIQE